MLMRGKCPICGQSRESRKYNKHFPFCSERCKLIDLWNWFDEEYKCSEPVSCTDDDQDVENK